MENDIRAIKEVVVEDEDTSSDVTSRVPFDPNDIRVTTNPMNLGDLIDMLAEGWINIDTEYQRRPDLWTPEKKKRLIESVLLGLRLPAFYFEEVNRRQWNIIDGLQRCCAIRDFCVSKTLKLDGLEFLDAEKYGGKTFEELSFADRRDIRMLPITVNLLDKGSPIDVKYILFSRLNTGGVPLTSQEVRSAVFHGRAIDTIVEMAECEEFKEATCRKIDPKRQEDRDFVSRFVAFYVQGHEQYQPDLDRYIRESLKTLNDNGKWSDANVRRMVRDFKEAMRTAQTIFGDDAFRKRWQKEDQRRPINKAYFEVMSCTLAKLSEAERQQLIERKQLLKDNLLVLMQADSFWNSLSRGTGTEASVKERFVGFGRAVQYALENRRMKKQDDTRN